MLITQTKSEFLGYSAFLIIGTAVIILLAQHAVREFRKDRDETRSINISIDNQTRLQIWQIIYQQSYESLRDMFKASASTNFAGLAGSITLLATQKAIPVNNTYIIASAVLFGIGLVFSMYPFSGLSEKSKEDLSEIMRSMDKQDATLKIHHTWPKGGRFFSAALALAILGGGIVSLVFAFITTS